MARKQGAKDSQGSSGRAKGTQFCFDYLRFPKKNYQSANASHLGLKRNTPTQALWGVSAAKTKMHMHLGFADAKKGALAERSSITAHSSWLLTRPGSPSRCQQGGPLHPVGAQCRTLLQDPCHRPRQSPRQKAAASTTLPLRLLGAKWRRQSCQRPSSEAACDRQVHGVWQLFVLQPQDLHGLAGAASRSLKRQVACSGCLVQTRLQSEACICQASADTWLRSSLHQHR